MRNGTPQPLPGNYGFNMTRAYAHTRDQSGVHDNTYDPNGKLIPDGVKDPTKARHSEDLFQEDALAFIRTNQSKPFFLYYATQLPHGPCITPHLGAYKDKPWGQKHKEWAAMVTHLDSGVGRMVALLEELELLDNTIIFFAGDNGYSQWGYFGRPAFEDDPLFRNKGPWPKGKFTCTHEGGLRVPFFAYWKGKIQTGESDHLCALYDILATVAELADVTAPPTDGVSLVPTLLAAPEKQKKHEYLYWENGTRSPHTQSVRLNQYWAYRPHPSQPIELYDLDRDIACARDVAQEHPEVVMKVRHIFQEAHARASRTRPQNAKRPKPPAPCKIPSRRTPPTEAAPEASGSVDEGGLMKRIAGTLLMVFSIVAVVLTLLWIRTILISFPEHPSERIRQQMRFGFLIAAVLLTLEGTAFLGGRYLRRRYPTEVPQPMKTRRQKCLLPLIVSVACSSAITLFIFHPTTKSLNIKALLFVVGQASVLAHFILTSLGALTGFKLGAGVAKQTTVIALSLLYYTALFYPALRIVTMDRTVKVTRYRLMTTLLVILLTLHILMAFVTALLLRA